MLPDRLQYVAAGYKRRLELDDVLEPPEYVGTEQLCERFIALWREDVEPSGKKKSLAPIMWRLFKYQWAIAILWRLISAGFSIAGPMLAKQLIVVIKHSHNSDPPPLSHGLVTLAILFLVNILDAAVNAGAIQRAKLVSPHHSSKFYVMLRSLNLRSL